MNPIVLFRKRLSNSTGGDPIAITLPNAQWGVPYNETGSATGWEDGSYDIGNGITMVVSNETYTATGTPQ